MPPGGTGWSNIVPSSDVTVCARVLVLLQTTRSPGATVIDFGSKDAGPIPTGRSAASASEAGQHTAATTTANTPTLRTNAR